MKIKLSKRHLPFGITYFVSLIILLLNQINELPMSDTLRKVKYPYVFVVGLLIIINPTIKKGIKSAIFVLFLFFAHDIIFGYAFVSYLVPTQVADNASQMLWFLLFVFVTFLYVAQNNYFKEFIVLSYYATGIQLLVAAINHKGNFVNPLWGLVHAFTSDSRYRNSFGFVHAGYTSNACFLVFVLSIFFFEIYRRTNEIKRPWFWISFLSIDGLAGLMIASAAERAGIICTAMVLFVYFFFVFFRLRIEKNTLAVFVFIGLLLIAGFAATGGFTDIWSKSNRELNISVNYPLFRTYGNTWTGLGFIESAGFQEDRNLFPMPTSSLDMYYVYIYFSTGLLGSIIIGTALMAVLIKFLINRRTDFNIIIIGFYLSLLFYAVWQCNLFTHRYISSYIISILLLCGMSDDFCMGENICTNTWFME